MKKTAPEEPNTSIITTDSEPEQHFPQPAAETPQDPVAKLHYPKNSLSTLIAFLDLRVHEPAYDLTQQFQHLLKAGDLQSLTQFLQDLLKNAQLDDTQENFAHLITASYLIQHFQLQDREAIIDQVEIMPPKPDQQMLLNALIASADKLSEITLTSEGQSQRNHFIHKFETSYLEHLLTLQNDGLKRVQQDKPKPQPNFSRKKGMAYLNALHKVYPDMVDHHKNPSAIDSQWAVDVITQCNHMHSVDMPFKASSESQRMLSLATENLLLLLLNEVIKNPKVLMHSHEDKTSANDFTDSQKPTQDSAQTYPTLEDVLHDDERSPNPVVKFVDRDDYHMMDSEQGKMLLSLTHMLTYYLFVYQNYDALYGAFSKFQELIAHEELSLAEGITTPEVIGHPKAGISIYAPLSNKNPSENEADNPSAKLVRDKILHTLQLPITESESHEQFLNRLAAVIALLDEHQLFPEHKIRRTIQLIHAEHVVNQKKTTAGLTAKKLDPVYDFSSSHTPQEYFDNFVLNRPGSYLIALCRVYRQHQAVFHKAPTHDFGITLIKHFLSVKYPVPATLDNPINPIVDISAENASLVHCVLLKDQCTITALLFEECTAEQLQGLILWDFTAATDTLINYFGAENAPFSDETLRKIAEGLIKTDRHREFLTAVRNQLKSFYRLIDFYFICTVIFEQMKKDDLNIDCLINTLNISIHNMTNSKFIVRDLQQKRCNKSLFSELLESLSKESPLYLDKVLPTLNNFVWQIANNKLIKNNKRQHQYDSITELLLSLLKHGVSLLTTQKIVLNDGNQALSNALLSLIKGQGFATLKILFEHCRDNAEALVNSPLNTNSCDHNPLFMAMNNNADYTLTMMMLELGFSQSLVKHYLSEKCNSAEVELAAPLRSNAPAIRALNEFNELALQRTQSQNHRLLKEIAELRKQSQSANQLAKNEIDQLRQNTAKLQQELAKLRQQLEDQIPAAANTPPCAQQITLGILGDNRVASLSESSQTNQSNIQPK